MTPLRGDHPTPLPRSSVKWLHDHPSSHPRTERTRCLDGCVTSWRRSSRTLARSASCATTHLHGHTGGRHRPGPGRLRPLPSSSDSSQAQYRYCAACRSILWDRGLLPEGHPAGRSGADLGGGGQMPPTTRSRGWGWRAPEGVTLNPGPGGVSAARRPTTTRIGPLVGATAPPGNRDPRPGPIMRRVPHVPRVSGCTRLWQNPGNRAENPPSSRPCRGWPACLAVDAGRSEPVSSPRCGYCPSSAVLTRF